MLDERAQRGAPIERYVVQEYLAEGGMGAIYLGKKLGAGGFEKEVVLKQLLPEFTQQPEFIDLFLREARLSATLDHANIVHTIDLVTAGEEYFIVMEYLDGADLRTLVKRAKLRKKRFSPPAGIFIAREILSALTYAHSKLSPDGKPLRLIHRDISPSNILISQNGEVKLTDFGIAKASTHNSVFYRVKGKVGYMSPEQARSETLDARSDLYSLAVCLYEAITGEKLFVQISLTTPVEEIYRQPVPLISRKVPGLPAEFDKLMLKALSLEPRDRFQTAGEFQDALLRVAHRHGLLASAPELAEHLVGICGPRGTWRELDDLKDEIGRAGTEIYDDDEDPARTGTERLSPDELDDYGDDMFSAVIDLDQLVDEDQRRQKRAMTHVTSFARLQGMELTSLINVAEATDEGAKPLVDLDAFGVISGDGREGDLNSDEHQSQDSVEIDRELVREAVREARRAKSERGKRPKSERPSRLKVAESDEIDVRRAMAPDRPPWLVVVIMLLVGAGVAAAIGLSGPSIPSKPSAKDAPSQGQ